MLAQCFANGATGFAWFEDPYTDDPGAYLALAEAIGIAAEHEDIIINGTGATAVLSVSSGNAVGSAVALGGRHFIALSPDAINAYTGTDRPPPSMVDVSFDAGSGAAMELRDLRDKSKPPVQCAGGKCSVRLVLDSTAVFLFAPPTGL